MSSPTMKATIRPVPALEIFSERAFSRRTRSRANFPELTQRALRLSPSPHLSARSLRRDPHGSVKQIHHEELEDGEKERPSAFPKIMLKQTDSGIQQLHGTGERTQDQQRRRRLLVDRPQCEQSQRNS